MKLDLAPGQKIAWNCVKWEGKRFEQTSKKIVKNQDFTKKSGDYKRKIRRIINDMEKKSIIIRPLKGKNKYTLNELFNRGPTVWDNKE